MNRSIKNSLVTGGAGFIGSHVVDELVKRKHNIVVLDDLSGGNKENIHPEATFIEGSILDKRLVKSLFYQYQFDYVYHLAAYAAEGLSHFIRRFNYQNNVIGSINLINASVKHKVKCFVFTSSIAVYGTNQLPMHEELIPEPEDPYGIAKYTIELDLKAAHKMFGLNYVIFRPHNVYGEKQNINDPYRNVIGIFMNQILNGKALTIYGDGKQTRAFSYIDDVAPPIASAPMNGKAKNQIFNIGNDIPITVNKIAKTVLEAMNMEAKILHLEKRNEVEHAYASHQKFHTYFNVDKSKITDIETGISKMATWAKTQKLKQPNTFETIEIEKNLPENWKKKA